MLLFAENGKNCSRSIDEENSRHSGTFIESEIEPFSFGSKQSKEKKIEIGKYHDEFASSSREGGEVAE